VCGTYPRSRAMYWAEIRALTDGRECSHDDPDGDSCTVAPAGQVVAEEIYDIRGAGEEGLNLVYRLMKDLQIRDLEGLPAPSLLRICKDFKVLKYLPSQQHITDLDGAGWGCDTRGERFAC
jgi:hypothetical protein